MLNDFIDGLGKCLLMLSILAFIAILGYTTGDLIEVNPQITSAGFVIVALILGVVSIIRGGVK